MYRHKTSPEAVRKSFRKIRLLPSKGMIQFLLHDMHKAFWHKYHCFSLFRADNINKVLLWLLLPMSLVSYYVVDSLESVDAQWYVYFTSQQFYILLLSWIVYNQFRGTRHSGIATAVLVKGVYNTVSEALGINNKYSLVEEIWIVMVFGLIIYAIHKYYVGAKH